MYRKTACYLVATFLGITAAFVAVPTQAGDLSCKPTGGDSCLLRQTDVPGKQNSDGRVILVKGHEAGDKDTTLCADDYRGQMTPGTCIRFRNNSTQPDEAMGIFLVAGSYQSSLGQFRDLGSNTDMANCRPNENCRSTWTPKPSIPAPPPRRTLDPVPPGPTDGLTRRQKRCSWGLSLYCDDDGGGKKPEITTIPPPSVPDPDCIPTSGPDPSTIPLGATHKYDDGCEGTGIVYGTKVERPSVPDPDCIPTSGPDPSTIPLGATHKYEDGCEGTGIVYGTKVERPSVPDPDCIPTSGPDPSTIPLGATHKYEDGCEGTGIVYGTKVERPPAPDPDCIPTSGPDPSTIPLGATHKYDDGCEGTGIVYGTKVERPPAPPPPPKPGYWEDYTVIVYTARERETACGTDIFIDNNGSWTFCKRWVGP